MSVAFQNFSRGNLFSLFFRDLAKITVNILISFCGHCLEVVVAAGTQAVGGFLFCCSMKYIFISFVVNPSLLR